MALEPKAEVTADELAQILYESMIAKRCVNMPSDLVVSPEYQSAFQCKITDYQFASVALAVAYETDLAFRLVEQQLNSRGLNEDRLVAIETLKPILSSNEPAAFSRWARTWLREIGIKETNPTVLVKFTYGWKQHHELAVETLKNTAIRTN